MTYGNSTKTAKRRKIKKKNFTERPKISDAKPENSRHKEDFERLLDDAVGVRKKK
jgi:hypothetical protein